MTDFLPPVVAVLTSEIGGFMAGMGKAQAEMTRVESSVKKLSVVGKAALLGLAAGATAVAYESVKMAASFDQQMELIHTQAGASQAEVDALKRSVLDLAPTVGIGPEKLAEGLYHVESAGFRGQAALDILAAAAKDSAVGLADMESVSQALIGTMAVGFGDVTNAADAAAYLNKIVGIGDMRMEKLAAAISTGVLPSFKSAGLGMTDFGAALATLTDNVTPADEAATRLRMTVALMSAPTKKAEEALAKIHMTGTQMAEDMRKPNGLLVAIMDLKKHLDASGLSAVQQHKILEEAFGGGRTSGAILTLLEETDRLKSKYDELGTAQSRQKEANEAWAAQQEQFSQKLHDLTAKLEVYGIKVGNWLIPKIESAVTWFGKHKEAAKVLAVAIGTLLVGAVTAFTVSVMEATVALATNPFTWLLGAVVALGVGLYELFTHIKEIDDALAAAGQFFISVWGGIEKWFQDNIAAPLEAIWHAIPEDIRNALTQVFDVITAPFRKAYNWIKDQWDGVVQYVAEKVLNLTPHIAVQLGADRGQGGAFHHDSLPTYGDGGTVGGPRGRAQLAVVHGGERILSLDELDGLGPGVPYRASPWGGGDIHVHVYTTTNLDGKTIAKGLIPHAQRAKYRNGITGLA